jgi:hypothetical protein
MARPLPLGAIVTSRSAAFSPLWCLAAALALLAGCQEEGGPDVGPSDVPGEAGDTADAALDGPVPDGLRPVSGLATQNAGTTPFLDALGSSAFREICEAWYDNNLCVDPIERALAQRLAADRPDVVEATGVTRLADNGATQRLLPRDLDLVFTRGWPPADEVVCEVVFLDQDLDDIMLDHAYLHCGTEAQPDAAE